MTSMKVKVSKVMANAIAKAMQERGMEFEECKVQKFSERGYVLNVAGMDGVYDAQENGDYDWSSGEFKAIRIVWPYNYYAMPTYLTTKELLNIKRQSHADDVTKFMIAVCDKIAI